MRALQTALPADELEIIYWIKLDDGQGGVVQFTSRRK